MSPLSPCKSRKMGEMRQQVTQWVWLLVSVTTWDVRTLGTAASKTIPFFSQSLWSNIVNIERATLDTRHFRRNPHSQAFSAFFWHLVRHTLKIAPVYLRQDMTSEKFVLLGVAGCLHVNVFLGLLWCYRWWTVYDIILHTLAFWFSRNHKMQNASMHCMSADNHMWTS